MKKLFTLLMLMVCAIGTAWAGDVYKLQLNGKNVEIVNGETSSSLTFFSYNSAKHNFNTKFNGATYDGVDYTSGLKMEGTTSVSWSSSASSTVTIVQSTWSSNTIKFDGVELAVADAESGTNCRVYTITGVNAGEHSMTRGSGESGVFAITVEYTGATMTQLSAPEITINTTNGEVTIGSVENASKVTYTTDGTDPTAESTEYTAAFTVEDGVTVKAIAVGDNESYINSIVASKLAILEGVTIASPVIKQFNGTVGITCETAGTTIEYSLDGSTYNTYTRAFTLTEDGTVYARAKRGETTSEVVTESVATISKGDANKTIWMGIGSFTDNDKNVMTGAAGDDAAGIVLAITGNTEKKWSSGTSVIKIGDIERTSIKLSNGAQNTMTLPDGMRATRITFYSFINSSEARSSYWKEFNGTEIDGDVPMGAWNTVTDRLTNPDVRVFPLNGESSFTFTNAGEQLCFIIALDVIEAEDPVLNVSAEELTFKTSPYSKTSTATVKLTGSYLNDGDYNIELPSISGLSIEPTSFTVTDGAVSQEFTLTYAPETGETTTAKLSFGTSDASAEVSLVFESRAEAYEQAVVSEAATWNWKALTAELELKAETTPAINDEFVLAELEDQIEFVESFGDPKAIVMKGMQYPSRNKKAQGNGVIKIKTSVAGSIQVVYSNTGGSNNNRWPTINGQTFGDEAVGTAETTANTPVLPAGEIEIGSTGALRWYSITFTPADAPTITAEITSAGYATFSSLFEVEIPDGVEAYYASASEGTTVTMTSIDGGVIPAGTGVVLKGAEGSYTMAVSNTGATLDATNLLKANIADRTPGEAEYYTLAAGPKFSKSTGGVLAAGKAYLVIPGGSARTMTMKFSGEATGISELKSVAEEGALYNLSGARVSKPTKGLYIQNGKKLIVK